MALNTLNSSSLEQLELKGLMPLYYAIKCMYNANICNSTISCTQSARESGKHLVV